jgi:hypothetical protein
VQWCCDEETDDSCVGPSTSVKKNVTTPTGQPPSRHRLGPRDMSFEAKRFRHVAVAIPELAITAR